LRRRRLDDRTDEMDVYAGLPRERANLVERPDALALVGRVRESISQIEKTHASPLPAPAAVGLYQRRARAVYRRPSGGRRLSLERRRAPRRGTSRARP
jgi:hypothetical protein